MNRTEFIAELKALIEDIEKGTFHITEIDGGNRIFCNRNYGQIWTTVNEGCTISFDLYHATDEEKKQPED